MDEQRERHLRDRAALIEPSFQSKVPVVGGLIAGFRELWNSVSTKWYVRALAQQQSEFNRSVLDELGTLEGRLIDQDRDMALLHRDLAEITVQLVALSDRLAELRARRAEPGEE